MGKSIKRRLPGIATAIITVIVGVALLLGSFLVYHNREVTAFLLRYKVPEIIEREYPDYLRKKQFPPLTEVDKKDRAWFKVLANNYEITIAERATTGTYIIAYERKSGQSSLFMPQVVVSVPISVNPGEQRTLGIINVERASKL